VCLDADKQQALVEAAVISFRLAMGTQTSSWERAAAAVQTATGMPSSAAMKHCVQVAMERPVDVAGALHFCSSTVVCGLAICSLGMYHAALVWLTWCLSALARC
jgi:hypothetical protein